MATATQEDPWLGIPEDEWLAPPPAKDTPFEIPPEEELAAVEGLSKADDFDHVGFALANPESVESMFQVDKKLKVRSFGEKAGDFATGVGRALSKPIDTGFALGKGAIDFTLGLGLPAYHTISRLGHEAGGGVSRVLGRTEHAEMSEREALRHKAEAVISGQKIETNTRNVARIAGNLFEGAVEDLPAQQKEEDDRQDFLARVETRRKREQLAQSKPLDQGWVAEFVKITEDQKPSEAFGPEALEVAGAPPARQWLTDTMATGADPTNLLLRPGMSLPGARQAAGAALEGVGALTQAPGALLGGLPGRYGRGVSVGAALGETVLTQSFPMTSAKVAAVVAGTKGLQKVGKLLQMQGKELRTGQPSELTTRIATKRIGGERPALADVTGRTVADAVGTGGQAAIGLAPLNLALSEGNPEEFIQLEGIAGTFGGLHRLGAGGRRMLIEGARPFLRSEGARTLDTSTPLGEKSARFIMSLPDGIRDTIFETIGMFQGLPTEAAGGQRSDAKVYVLSHADYLRQVAKVSDAAASGGDGFAVAEGGTAYIDGEQTTQRGNTQETLGHEVGGHIGPTIVRAMGRKGAPLWEAVTKSAMEGLFKNGKTTEDFQGFIDAYNTAYDPTGETKRLDPADPEAIEEFVAETAGQIIRGEGAASLALPKNILDRINAGIVKLSGRLFGVDTEKTGGQTSFDLQEVGEITQAVREMLTGIADVRFRGPEGPSGVRTPPEAQKPATGNVAQPRGAPEAPVTPIPESITVTPPKIGQATLDALRDYHVGGLYPPQAQRANTRRGIPAKSTDKVAEEKGAEFDQMAEAYLQDLDARDATPPANSQELYQAIIQHALRSSPEAPPGIVPSLARVANEQVPEEPLSGRAPVLQDVAVAGVPPVAEAPGDRGVPKADQVDPDALTHYPEQSPEHQRVLALQANLGKVVFLKERAASKRDESKDYDAEERAKEQTPVDKREEVTFDDMPFIAMKIALGKKGVYARGFAPAQAVRNLDALLAKAAEEGVPTPFDGMTGPELDAAVEDAYHRYVTNQENGYDGTGTKPLRKPGSGYDYLPEPNPKGVLPLSQEIADLINASMGVRNVRGAEGDKALALNLENQGPREGDQVVNPFLQKLTGLNPKKLDDPFRTAVNVETVRGEISPAEGEGRSIRPSGINIDFVKAFPFKPQFEAVAAGFRPKTEKIKAAAFRLKDGSIWTGQTHFRIQDDSGFKKRANSLGGVEDFSDAVSGFVTESGRFVDSEEAYTISKAAKQLMQDDGDFNAKAEDLRIDQNLKVKEQKGVEFRPKETPPTEEKPLSTFKRQKEPPLSGLGQFRPKTKEQEAYEERLIKDPATTAKMLENKRGVSVLSADDILAKSPDAKSDTLEQSMEAYPERHADFAKPARDAAFTYLLSQPFQRDGRVLMTSGGSGSGKSTTIALRGDPDLIYDTNLGNYAKDKQKIEEALASGRIVEIIKIDREVGDAMRGNLERGPSEKRVVSADVLAEAHVNATANFKRLAEEYKDDPRVQFYAYRNVRNKAPVEIKLEEVTPLELEATRKRVHSVLDEIANGKDPEWTKGPLPQSIINVARGKMGEGGRGPGERDARAGRGDEGSEAPRGPLASISRDALKEGPLSKAGEAPTATQRKAQLSKQERARVVESFVEGRISPAQMIRAFQEAHPSDVMSITEQLGAGTLNKLLGEMHLRKVPGAPEARSLVRQELNRRLEELHPKQSVTAILGEEILRKPVDRQARKDLSRGDEPPLSSAALFSPKKDFDKLYKEQQAIQRKLDNAWYAPNRDESRIQELRAEKARVAEQISAAERPDKKAVQPGGDETIPTSLGRDVRPGHQIIAHWSTVGGLKELDPAFHGKGRVGAERARRAAFPDRYVNRIYIGYGDYRQESGIGNNKYVGDIDFRLLYDQTRDPGDLFREAVKVAGPNPEKGRIATEFERLIKEQGYLGYHVDAHQIAALFHKIPTNTSVGIKEYTKAAPEYARLLQDKVQFRPKTEEQDRMAAISVNPGYGRNFNPGLSYEQASELSTQVLKKVAPGGAFKFLTDSGVQNLIHPTIGQFEGKQEPSFAIQLPESDFTSAKRIASILGDALLQDSVIPYEIKPDGSQFGIIAEPPKGILTPETIADFRKWAESRGQDFTLWEQDGKIVLFDAKMFSEDNYGAESFSNFTEVVNPELISMGLTPRAFQQNSKYIIHEQYKQEITGGEETGKGVSDQTRNRVRPGRSPDLLDAARRSLYQPAREIFQAYFEKLGFKPEGKWPEGKFRPTTKEPDELGFYSELRKTIEEKLSENATPKQILAMLDPNKSGVKKEEVEWLGVSEFMEGKESVSKKELLDFLDINQVEMKEIVKSDIPEVTHPKDEEVKAWWNEDQGNINTSRDWDNLTASAKNQAREEYGIDRDTLPPDTQEQPSPTKFSTSTLSTPGGTNYKEFLYTLPLENKAYDSALEAFSKVGKSRQEYNSPHWDEPNVLAHTREADHVDVDGNKVRLVEEAQSDWHLEGRKKGYKRDETRVPEFKVVGQQGGQTYMRFNTKEEAQSYIDGYDSKTKENLKIVEGDRIKAEGVPDAPFKTSWYKVLMKRALRRAAEEGMDKLAWTTGEQQIDRYDLSKHLSSIVATVSSRKSFAEIPLAPSANIQAYDKQGNSVISKQVPFSELSGTIGKELADKIIAQEPGNETTYEGLDLKVGGEGKKILYDRTIPEFVRRYVKQWGGKVEQSALSTASSSGKSVWSNNHPMAGGGREQFIAARQRENPEANLVAIDNADGTYTLFDRNSETKVWSVTITDSMRESVKQGQPLFRPTTEGKGAESRLGKSTSSNFGRYKPGSIKPPLADLDREKRKLDLEEVR